MLNDALRRTQEQVELWKTRGVGGTRVFTPHRVTHPTVQWLKPVPSSVDFDSLSWYVDASQIDETTGCAARFGVGAVAVSPLGELVAAVRAVPPAHVRSIPSAEAWAISLVFTETPSRRAVYTDCNANLAVLARGRLWATSGKRAAARIWVSIFNAIDGDEGQAGAVTWMPALKSQAQIGVAKKSNGEHITAVDWLANMAVDELAKPLLAP